MSRSEPTRSTGLRAEVEENPIGTLMHAINLIEHATFELADKASSDLIGQLIAATAELDRAARQIGDLGEARVVGN